MNDLEEQIRQLQLRMAMDARKRYWPTWSDTPGMGNQAPWQIGMPGMPEYNRREPVMHQYMQKRGMSVEDMLKLKAKQLDLYNNSTVAGYAMRNSNPRFVPQTSGQWDSLDGMMQQYSKRM